MSSRRSRVSRPSEDEINDLILKLQALLPDANSRVGVTKILEELCSYIKRLNTEVDDLSDRLSQLLASMDSDDIHAPILTTLLQQ